MRLASFLLLASLCTAVAAPGVNAQVVSIGGGCTVPNGNTPTAPFAVRNEQPTIGNVNFGIEYVCPFGSTAAFALFGGCEPAPFPDFLDPMGAGLCGTPCGRTVSFFVPFTFFLFGAVIPPTKTVWSLPMPNNPGLVGQSFCMQFLCFDLALGTGGCLGLSQGVRITVQ
jgi:hypothetical protein